MTRRVRPIEYVVDPETGCHVCTSHAANKGGYSVVRIEGRSRPVHRVVYERHNGAIPDGLVVRHTCDNRRCINPSHLIVGTYRDNITDAIERSRYPFGQRHVKAKLTDDAVRYIHESGESTRELADRFGVSHATILMVRTGLTWKRVKATSEEPK